MVKIKRGDHETLVSMDSYNTIFKSLGYTLVETETPKKVEVTKKVEVSKKVEIPKRDEKDSKKKKKQED